MNEVTLQETEDGELFFQLPDDMIERLGWTEGCELEFSICEEIEKPVEEAVEGGYEVGALSGSLSLLL